ncbi:hypothetical protein F5144DRAFT_366652 [Chaetomium tenue]|uniref:Uncharacterized protein n=1 Tax=Chaetomium tenue TaxID=1854479 RepID=A0ACB7NYX0_9PEZI|nr:hypothetical protein F5144DRAFT_366652 [Chaetomium globosum]
MPTYYLHFSSLQHYRWTPLTPGRNPSRKLSSSSARVDASHHSEIYHLTPPPQHSQTKPPNMRVVKKRNGKTRFETLGMYRSRPPSPVTPRSKIQEVKITIVDPQSSIRFLSSPEKTHGTSKEASRPVRAIKRKKKGKKPSRAKDQSRAQTPVGPSPASQPTHRRISHPLDHPDRPHAILALRPRSHRLPSPRLKTYRKK